jgi:hypothetical protein
MADLGVVFQVHLPDTYFLYQTRRFRQKRILGCRQIDSRINVWGRVSTGCPRMAKTMEFKIRANTKS